MIFVELLYVILIYYVSGNAKLSSEAKKIIQQAHDESQVLLTLTPYLGDVIKAMEKSESVDTPALSVALTEMLKHYSTSMNANSSFIEVIKTFSKWFKNQGGSSYSQLAKIVSRVDSDYIRSMVTEDPPDQSKVHKQLQLLCTKMGFKGKAVLTPDECKEAKNDDPELYKDYLSLRRQHTMSWKLELSNYVKASGKKLVPCKNALAKLAADGIEHSIPTGFAGLIDAEGNWYTNAGEMLNNVPKYPTFVTVTMKTKADGEADWICKANKPDGTFAYVYTKEHFKTAADHKYAITKELIKNIDKYRRKWLANITKPFKYDEANAVASVIIELLYLSSDRVGSTKGGNEGGEGFGMCSIFCRMVTVRPDGSVLISYRGKDGVPFKFVLKPGNAKDKIICEVLAKIIQGKKPSDQVWTVLKANGNWRALSYTAVVAYFKSLTGANAHKLRTIAGTGLFIEEAEKFKAANKGKKLTEKQAVDAVVAIATKVGKKLGHIKTDAQGNVSTQPMTSLKNYIDFDAQVEFFTNFELPIPAYLAKLIKTDNSITSSAAVLANDTGVISPIIKPITDKVVKPGGKKDWLTDDEGNQVDQTGGPVTKRLTVRFLNGESQNSAEFF